MKNKILIKRLWIISVVKCETIDLKKKIYFLSGLSSLWYQVKNPELFNDSVLNDFDEKINILNQIRWWQVWIVPLFENFPENIPEDNSYFSERVIWFIWNLLWEFSEWIELDNWIVIPEWLFDLNKFWADPITQFQDLWIIDKAILRQNNKKEDSNIIWINLKFVLEYDAEKELFKYLENLLYSKSSIKISLKEELEFLINYFWIENIDFTKIVFKETSTFITKYLWNENEYEFLTNILKSPIDLLRLFASITSSDVSLSRNIKFPKFKRAQRKFILNFIEQKLIKNNIKFWDNYSEITDEFVKYDRLWVSLAEYLHPWEYSKQFPNTYLLFDKLRNGKINTYNSILENAIKEKNIEKALNLLLDKPGIFARKLHEILGLSWNKQWLVLTIFEDIWNKIQVKNLLVMKKYFETIEWYDKRTIINKKWNIKILENKSKNISDNILNKLWDIIDKLIVENIKIKSNITNKTWKDKKIYIEKWLDKIIIPLSQRNASDWILSVGRWSRINIKLEDTLRLFVYWKQKETRTDLDLSLIRFDEDLNMLWQVSYTNLKDWNIVHSWDIQSAPYWASEFIDIDFSALLGLIWDKKEKKNFFQLINDAIFSTKSKLENPTRYLVPQIYRFAWEKFDELTCYSWWMIRKDASSDYKTFDIKTVQNKFDINWKCSYVIPFIVDLYDEEIIFLDLFVYALSTKNSVEGSLFNISTIVWEIIKMVDSKPNIKDLAVYNIKALDWIITDNLDQADIVFWLHEWDYNLVNNVEKILNDLI